MNIVRVRTDLLHFFFFLWMNDSYNFFEWKITRKIRRNKLLNCINVDLLLADQQASRIRQTFHLLFLEIFYFLALIRYIWPIHRLANVYLFDFVYNCTLSFFSFCFFHAWDFECNNIQIHHNSVNRNNYSMFAKNGFLWVVNRQWN